MSVLPRMQPWQRLSWRVFWGTMLLVIVLLLVVLTLATTGARRSARATAQRSLEQSADLVAQLLAGRGRSLGGGARVFVQGPYFRTLVAEQRRDDILDQTFEAAEQLEASWVFITNDEGTLVAKSDEPSAFGESLAEVPLISSALRGQITSGFGGSGDSVLFQATAVPIAAPGGMPFGVLVATRILDSLAASDIALATNTGVFFFVRDAAGDARISAASVSGTPSLRNELSAAIVRALTAPRVSSAASLSAGRGHHEFAHGGRNWLWYSAPLSTAGGAPVGGYVVARPADDALATLAPVKQSLALAAIVGILCAFVAATLTAQLIARPVAQLAEQVAALVEQGELATDGTSSSFDAESPLAPAEITALVGAVDALVRTSHDQDLLRPLIAAVPEGVAAADRATLREAHAPSAAAAAPRVRTLTFRAPPTEHTSRTPIDRLLAQRYRLDAEVGHGGLGTVYRAHDVVLDETVAIKLLRPEAMGGASDSATLMAAEVRLARRVTHRHVVRLHDIGDADGEPFISMEYVDGVSLAQLIAAHGSLTPRVVAALARQLLRGLAAAHAQGVVHGDIKPHNLLVSRAGILKVSDFGLARLVRAEWRSGGGASVVGDVISGRLHGASMGTPEYMAPELLVGAEPSPASDCYSAGLVLHECLVGGTPFSAHTPVGLIGAKLQPTPPRGTRITPLAAEAVRRQYRIPPAVEGLVGRMTASDATQRPTDLAPLISAWQRVETGLMLS